MKLIAASRKCPTVGPPRFPAAHTRRFKRAIAQHEAGGQTGRPGLPSPYRSAWADVTV